MASRGGAEASVIDIESDRCGREGHKGSQGNIHIIIIVRLYFCNIRDHLIFMLIICLSKTERCFVALAHRWFRTK